MALASPRSRAVDRRDFFSAAEAKNFVIRYPPGFLIMVPGQVITDETLTFMRQLDVKEIHGYHAAHGLKLLKPDVLATRKVNGGRND